MNNSSVESEELSVTIRPLRIPEDGNALAELFNAFNQSWEGGFIGHGENTPEMVIEIASRLQKLEIFVAEGSDGRLLGYCSVHPHFRDTEAAFVGILGAHPEALGKKVGKRLMLKALEKTIEENRTRFDLGTWAGNFKAMPLYKKLGFFWVPDTSALMENFLPLILIQPAFLSFWTKHPDWYSIFKRELSQSPDTEELDGLHVYTYHFEEDGDHLTVWIDRYAKDIVGFDLLLEGTHTRMQLLSNTNTAHRGLSHACSLIIVSSETIPTVKIDGIMPDGVEMHLDFPREVESVSDTTLDGSLRITVDAPLYKPQFKGLSPKVKISWRQNQQISLNLGLKIESAIEIELTNESKTISPNYDFQQLDLILTNKLKKQVQGILMLTHTKGFIPQKKEIMASLDPEERCLISIKTEEINSSIELEFGCKFLLTEEATEYSVETEEYVFKVPFLAPSRFHIIENPRKERVIIYNGFSPLELNLRGGIFQTFPEDDVHTLGLRETQALGPPYGFDEFNRLVYNWSVEKDDGKTVLTAWAKSEQRPGLVLKKKIFLEPNSHLLRIKHILENHTSDKSYDLGLQVENEINIGPNPFSYTIPFQGSYVKTSRLDVPRSAMDFGTDPSRFHESWLSLESPGSHQGVIGILWDKNKVNEIKIVGGMQRHFASLEYVASAKPEETKSVVEYYIYDGPGDWLTIRDLWFQRLASDPPDKLSIPKRQNFIAIRQASANPNKNNGYDINIEIETKLLSPISGLLIVTADQATFEPSEISFECSNEQLSIVKTVLLPKPDFDKPEISTQIKIQTTNTEYKEELQLTLPKSSAQGLIITPETRHSVPGFHWSHPLFDGFSAPSYSAGFVSLKHKGVRELVQSPFPDSPPSFFLVRERGGARFTLAKNFDDIIHGKDQIEYEASEVSEDDYRGLRFIPKSIEHVEGLKGISPEITFLAHPDRNDLLLNFKLTNQGKAPIEIMGLFELLPTLVEDLVIRLQVDGRSHTISSKPHKVIQFTDIGTPIVLESVSEDWKMILESPKNYISLGLIADVRPAKCYLEILIPVYLRPKEERTIDFKLRLV